MASFSNRCRKILRKGSNSSGSFWYINSLPNSKILDQSKLKAVADDKINLTEKLKFIFGMVEKHFRERRKCWFSAFPPFPKMFSKSFFKVV